MREIVLDTETTGLSPAEGHRVVEIGGVELVNRFPTGRTVHFYLNPDRDMPTEAFEVHGLSAEFLSDKPRFHEVADAFIEFIGDATLVIHNASFDHMFLNAELAKIGKPAIPRDRLLDTLLLARRKHPNGPNRLDDLCSRYGIDNSRRTKHGALLDSEILAEVYLELIGARQAQLGLGEQVAEIRIESHIANPSRQRPHPLPPRVSEAELAAHMAFVSEMGPAAVWTAYVPAEQVAASA
ncbi:DNA polymerase III subunit epsilon [Variibacter gotjawalensis]|uniref:DNA polymerase III subunit epsilon n=1 Tax=Variibacter gotjawalensis TaxID=1333996 RepID=A0A0S3PQK0_9BRAD|nr:DNA polymerase III subunit epsilon [Variibacter gotjawalensis]NIK48533.1 DNA polymerase-3 subunit epsilon [Variibacter gotjawalensis]RZS50398.1 DNA polymerase III epsilon subunit [Variibacter gotjawalensis]BAT58232.1 DNA polymerase III subunit epsilon [Variibacter gotjawalensis]